MMPLSRSVHVIASSAGGESDFREAFSLSLSLSFELIPVAQAGRDPFERVLQ